MPKIGIIWLSNVIWIANLQIHCFICGFINLFNSFWHLNFSVHFLLCWWFSGMKRKMIHRSNKNKTGWVHNLRYYEYKVNQQFGHPLQNNLWYLNGYSIIELICKNVFPLALLMQIHICKEFKALPITQCGK